MWLPLFLAHDQHQTSIWPHISPYLWCIPWCIWKQTSEQCFILYPRHQKLGSEAEWINQFPLLCVEIFFFSPLLSFLSMKLEVFSPSWLLIFGQNLTVGFRVKHSAHDLSMSEKNSMFTSICWLHPFYVWPVIPAWHPSQWIWKSAILMTWP